MQIKDAEKLKAWLLAKLEPLCDADPAALAKYVVALLRKDKPKSALKELCVDQLEVFLAKETKTFVEGLFRGLDSESYLTGRSSETPPPQTTPPNPNSSQTPKAPPTILGPAQTPPVKAQLTVPHSGGGSGAPGPAQLGSERSASGAGGAGGAGGGGERGRAGGGGAGRRHFEDPRSREVDDEDRDFRRSRPRGGRPGERAGRTVRGGVTVSREPDSSTGGSRRGNEGAAGVKGRSGSGPVSTSGDLRGKRRRGDGEGLTGGGVSSTGGRLGDVGVARRVVREKGWGHEEERPTRRSWPQRSRSRSRSSSSDSSSSSTGSSYDHGRKRSRQEWNERGSSSSRVVIEVPKKDEEEGQGGGEGEEQGEGGKRKGCKDYDEKGFCMLGDQCPFDHGVDPVVIGNNIPHAYPPPPSMVGIPSLALTKPDMSGFLVPPGAHAGRVSPTESTTDGYNPEDPGLTATTAAPSSFLPGPLLNPGPLLPRPFPPPHHQTHPPHMHGVPTLPPFPVGAFPPPPLPPPITSSASHQFPPPSHSHWPRPPQLSFPPMPRQPSDTLIVRKIPRESNTITKLSSHFEKFGTIVNLTVWYGGDPEGALVQFSTPFEARRAHDSAEAVLNNRFIKIYYLRKDMPFYSFPQLREPAMEVGGTGISICGPPQSSKSHTPSLSHLGTKPITVTAPQDHTHTHSHTAPSTTHTYVNPMSKPPASHAPQPSGQRKRRMAETAESKEMVKKRLELQRKTGELLQKQINQQKVLISKLEKGGKQMPADERKTIMKTLKLLSQSIDKMKAMASEAMESQLRSKQAPPSPNPPSPTPPSPTLTEKAQALRQEAHQLGLIAFQPLSQTTPTNKWTGSHVTGNASRAQKPDLRSVLNKKRLVVFNAENREQLTAHFDSFGGLVSVEVDPENAKNLIFSFRNAHLAQKAAKHGAAFNGKSLIMKWYTPPKPPSPAPYSQALPKLHPLSLPTPSLSLPLPTSFNTPTPDTPEVTTPTLATPTLTKLDPEALHLVEDDEDEESEERSWRR